MLGSTCVAFVLNAWHQNKYLVDLCGTKEMFLLFTNVEPVESMVSL